MDSPRFIALTHLAKHLNVHKTTLHRWASEGIRGTKLKTLMVGGRRRTTAEALDEFFQKLNQRKESYDESEE